MLRILIVTDYSKVISVYDHTFLFEKKKTKQNITKKKQQSKTKNVMEQYHHKCGLAGLYLIPS